MLFRGETVSFRGVTHLPLCSRRKREAIEAGHRGHLGYVKELHAQFYVNNHRRFLPREIVLSQIRQLRTQVDSRGFVHSPSDGFRLQITRAEIRTGRVPRGGGLFHGSLATRSDLVVRHSRRPPTMSLTDAATKTAIQFAPM